MRNNFEAADISLTEVDPYKRTQRHTPNGKGSNVSAIYFSAGRGSIGVGLCWHHTRKFKALSDDKKDKLRQWQISREGRNILDKSKKDASEKKLKRGDTSDSCDNKSQNKGGWKNKLKKAIKTPQGLKSIMAILASG